MANQILVDTFPGGIDISSQVQTFRGSIALAGSAVSTGEPLNWANLVSGIGYNEINREGNGNPGSATALTTGFAISSGVCTVTAANNFQVNQQVTFLGNTGTLSSLFNGVTVTVASATTTDFTFSTATTGTTTTGDVGLAVTANSNIYPLQKSNATLIGTVSALSASGGIVTVTAANTLLPGAQVVVTSASAGIGVTISGQTLPVLSSTGTAFTVMSAATGASGTGTFSAINPPQPFSVKVWSELLGSGYIYQYYRTTGVLYILNSSGFTPAGTNSAPTITTTTGSPSTLPIGVDGTGALTQTAGASGITGVQAPIFTGTPAAAAVLAKLAAGPYPAGVLADLVRYEATWAKG